MNLQKAERLADDFCVLLSPHCERIEIAGSVRRRKPDVGDIEIVAIPKTEKLPGMFDPVVLRDGGFITAMRRFPILKGQPETGKYIALQLHGIKADVFLATPDNWGLIYAIRVGSADFSHHTLAAGWVRAGYKSIEGMLTKVSTGKTVAVKEEADLFNLIGVKYIEPERRI